MEDEHKKRHCNHPDQLEPENERKVTKSVMQEMSEPRKDETFLTNQFAAIDEVTSEKKKYETDEKMKVKLKAPYSNIIMNNQLKSTRFN